MGESGKNVFVQVYWNGKLSPSTGVMALLTTHEYIGGRNHLLKLPSNKMNIWYVHGKISMLCPPGSKHLFFEQVPSSGQRYLQPLQTQSDYDDLARLGERVAGVKVYVLQDTPDLSLTQ